MDKIRDFIYEISDILFGALILITVILVTTNQLYSWFNLGNPVNSNDIYSQEKTSSLTSIDKNPNPVVSIEEVEVEKNHEVDEVSQEETLSTSDDLVIRNISIALGSNSQSIANALYENNLINSTQEFLDKLKDMGLERNIKAGTFQIPQSSTLEEVILIITK